MSLDSPEDLEKVFIKTSFKTVSTERLDRKQHSGLHRCVMTSRCEP